MLFLYSCSLFYVEKIPRTLLGTFPSPRVLGEESRAHTCDIYESLMFKMLEMNVNNRVCQLLAGKR